MAQCVSAVRKRCALDKVQIEKWKKRMILPERKGHPLLMFQVLLAVRPNVTAV